MCLSSLCAEALVAKAEDLLDKTGEDTVRIGCGAGLTPALKAPPWFFKLLKGAK